MMFITNHQTTYNYISVSDYNYDYIPIVCLIPPIPVSESPDVCGSQRAGTDLLVQTQRLELVEDHH